MRAKLVAMRDETLAELKALTGSNFVGNQLALS